ncbi:MAG: site-2 protease family protein, partial [Vagococcus sp.]
MVSTIVTFIFVFGLIVLVHEFGHFIFAKRGGILVREFAIGMGPELYSYYTGKTLYSIRIIPIGGFVNIDGMEVESKVENG